MIEPIKQSRPLHESADDKLNLVKAKDLAINLEATSRPSTARIYWEGDNFVRLGKSSVNCTKAFSRLNKKTKESLKSHFIDYCNEMNFGLRTLIDVIQLIAGASKTPPPFKFDMQWAVSALDSTNFRQKRVAILKFFMYWKDRFPTAITDDALIFLEKISPPPQHPCNVESDNPDKSWLTEEEYDAVLALTWQNYDETGFTQPALVRLLAMQYARRPQQFAELKFGDLKPNYNDNEAYNALAEPEIHFPSAKDKLAEQAFRTGKVEVHPIAEHLLQLLHIQRQQVTILFQSCLEIQLSDDDIALLPVFTTRQRVLEAVRILKEQLAVDVRNSLSDEMFHLMPLVIGRIISFKTNGGSTSIYDHSYDRIPDLPITPRTEKTLALSATRLRHTRARQLARQGVPKRILSHWLGHISERSLKSYYNDPAEEARQLEEQMSSGLIPIAMAFNGRIITSGEEASRAEDPESRLEIARDGRLSYVGHCGKFSFCSTTSIPVPCYRCKHFEPLVDAPHEEVLDALLYRQSQEQSVITRGGMRSLLIPIDLSADIRAVERCIALCKQMQKTV
ncbi:hypothetical protein BK664_01415 [Pseudomonas brassicacearum]|uniref:Integrase n=1 Tax=Pseudomonas brassicacearum TaxID=930166 RepID=A0A423JXV4_9PSED|nr:hypothetical protein BK664_01415 [Pseudomonas brassicacearum]